jgi:hypothetical protein
MHGPDNAAHALPEENGVEVGGAGGGRLRRGLSLHHLDPGKPLPLFRAEHKAVQAIWPLTSLLGSRTDKPCRLFGQPMPLIPSKR